MASQDKIVISLGDAVLRESDLELLKGPHWLNDRIISFYFEYLHENKFDGSAKLCFMSPEVSQFLKLASRDEIPLFLEPLNVEDKEVFLLAVNNSCDPDRPGGSHWSLLIFSRQAKEFFHLDSSNGMNEYDARMIAKKLYDFLVKKLSPFEFKFNDVPVLKQTNGYDCGIHVLSHAEHATRHYLVYGNADGLEPLDEKKVKNKRQEILDLVQSMRFGQQKEEQKK